MLDRQWLVSRGFRPATNSMDVIDVTDRVHGDGLQIAVRWKRVGGETWFTLSLYRRKGFYYRYFHKRGSSRKYHKYVVEHPTIEQVEAMCGKYGVRLELQDWAKF